MAIHEYERKTRLRDDTPSVLAIVASLVIAGLVVVYLFVPRVDTTVQRPEGAATATRLPVTTPGIAPPAIPSTTPIDKMAPTPLPPPTKP